MSKRKILAKLKQKGYTPSEVVYVRSCPVPEGYASGWDISFSYDSDELEDKVYNISPDTDFSYFMEFGDINEVYAWIDQLPDLKGE